MVNPLEVKTGGDTYLQRKTRKLLIFWDQLGWYNNGIPKNNKPVRQYTKSANQIYEKNWVEINYDSRGSYNTTSQIEFKTSMLRSSLCYYIYAYYAYIFVRGTITIAALAGVRENNGIQVVFKNCAPFTNGISEINNI